MQAVLDRGTLEEEVDDDGKTIEVERSCNPSASSKKRRFLYGTGTSEADSFIRFELAMAVLLAAALAVMFWRRKVLGQLL